MSATAVVDGAALGELLRRVSPLPEAAARAIRHLEGEEPDLQAAAQEVARDPLLTAGVLRMANSPFYGLTRRVTSLGEAVMVLGTHSLRRLVLSAAAGLALAGQEVPQARLHALWDHALASARAAEALAGAAGMPPGEASTAALLHDIGAMAMLAWSRRALGAVVGDLEAERAQVGFDHAEAGAAIAERWNFPEAVCEAIRGHHAPPDGAPDLAHLVHAGHVMACCSTEKAPLPAALEALAPGTRARLGAAIERAWGALGSALPGREDGP